MTTHAGLLERDEELRVVDAALDVAAHGGRGRLVLVEGPPGSGVSGLLRAALDAAQARAFEVVEARAALGAPAPLLSDADRLRSEVRRLRRPLVLAVDDAQWADAASLQTLLAVRPWLGERALVVLVGLHPGGARAPALLAHLRDGADADRLVPAPLHGHSVATLAAQRLGEEVSTGFAALACELTGGNVWLATVVLEVMAQRDLAPVAATLRALLDDVPAPLVHRAQRLLAERSPDAIALAQALAALAAPVALARAARVAELDLVRAAVAADELAGAGLAGSGEPLALGAPLLGAAVAAAMPAFARAAVHRRALEALRDDDASPVQLAGHLLAVPGAGDPVAVRTLRAAAAADQDRAVVFLRRALAEPPGLDAATALLSELALAEAAAGAPEAVDRLREALARDAPGGRRLQVALGRALLAAGDYQEAGALAEAVLDDLAPTDPAAEQLLLVELIACSVETSLHDSAMARLGRFAEAATAGTIPTDPGLCAWLAASMSATGASATTTRALIDRALVDSPLVDDAHPTVSSFVRAAMLNIDDVEGATASASAAMARARERGLPVARQLAQHSRAVAALAAGRLEDAIADARASQPGPGAAWTLHARYGAAVLVSAHAERGEAAAAREALAEAQRRAPNGPLEEANVLHAEGRLALAVDDPQGALQALLASGEALRSFGRQQLTPSCLRWASSAAIAAAAVGDLALARELAADELARARPTGLPGTIGIALRAAAAAETGGRRTALLTEAVDALERSPLRLEHAYGLVELGRAIHEDGDRVAARPALARALHLANQCGATLLAQRAREQLRRTGARPRRAALTGVDALTPRERDIAELAARGATNPQIAEALFVSVKTVEATLARVYRKLGIRSRKLLPDRLGRHS